MRVNELGVHAMVAKVDVAVYEVVVVVTVVVLQYRRNLASLESSFGSFNCPDSTSFSVSSLLITL